MGAISFSFKVVLLLDVNKAWLDNYYILEYMHKKVMLQHVENSGDLVNGKFHSSYISNDIPLSLYLVQCVLKLVLSLKRAKLDVLDDPRSVDEKSSGDGEDVIIQRSRSTTVQQHRH